MHPDDFFAPSAYKGSKDFSQQEIYTANATGFGAAADDYAERGIDLNEQLVHNKAATFFMRVSSDAMIDAGIHPGDVVVVDRSAEAKTGKVIIAVVDGELLIRILERGEEKVRLHPANDRRSIVEVAEKGLKVWGVVTFVIHSM